MIHDEEFWNKWLKDNDHIISKNEDGSINVFGNVIIRGQKLTRILVKFNFVKGDFDCGYNQLNSLENCPIEVRGYFNCQYNGLETIKGCPSIIGKSFYCHGNKLTSLEGCPQQINGNFDCSFNLLKSLEFGPAIVKSGYYFCRSNKLINLNGFPKSVDGKTDCSDNKLTTLTPYSNIIDVSYNNIFFESKKLLENEIYNVLQREVNK